MPTRLLEAIALALARGGRRHLRLALTLGLAGSSVACMTVYVPRSCPCSAAVPHAAVADDDDTEDPPSTADRAVQREAIFADDFDSYPLALNSASFGGNWHVTDGTVDVIGDGSFDFYPGHGRYVDLDGSTRAAGWFVSRPLELSAGEYELRFSLGGSRRGDTNVVDVSFGAAYQESFTLPSHAPLAPVVRSVTLETPGVARLSFHNRGGDNVGAILDDVSVTAIR
jgi:hypothetical protein